MYASAKRSRNPPAFGSEIRASEFSLNPSLTFLNQGSYGCVPKQVSAETRRNEDKQESDYDTWFRTDKYAELDAAMAVVAPFFGANPADMAFEENTTRAINNVMKSIQWESGDAILSNSWTFKAMKNLIDELLEDNEGLSKIELELPYPIASEDQIVQLYESILMQNQNIKLALLDHITSTPAMVFPVKRLVEVCHQHGVMVLIDGAHVPGHLMLNLDDIGADFYIGSLHKWCFTNRGCAIIRVDPKHHAMVKPVVTSNDYGESFPLNFKMQGLRNEAPYVSSTKAIEFIEWIGGMSAIQAYCTPMLEACVQSIAKEFNTTKMEIPDSMECPHLRCVQIPDIDGFENDARSLYMYIREKYNIWVIAFILSDKMFLRISGSVFSTEEDYGKLLDALKDLVQNGPDPSVLTIAKEKSKMIAIDY